MKILKTKGVVLRQIKYGESSVIVDILTSDNGIQGFIAGGVRKKKPQFHPYYFQALNLLEIVYYQNNRSDLFRIKELNASQTIQNIDFNVSKNAIRLFLAEIIRISSYKAEPNPQLFLFLEQLIQYIDLAEDTQIKNIHLWTLVKLMQFNGILPKNNYGEETLYFNPLEAQFEHTKQSNSLVYTQRQSDLFSQLLSTHIGNNQYILFSKQERRNLLEKMTEYLQIHIQHFSKNKSLEILFDIFE